MMCFVSRLLAQILSWSLPRLLAQMMSWSLSRLLAKILSFFGFWTPIFSLTNEFKSKSKPWCVLTLRSVSTAIKPHISNEIVYVESPMWNSLRRVHRSAYNLMWWNSAECAREKYLILTLIWMFTCTEVSLFGSF